MTFYKFLTTARSNDSVGDLGADVAADPQAPKTNAKLIAYLKERGVDEDALAGALTRWKTLRNVSQATRLAVSPASDHKY
jgi:hypothetical protein